MASLASEVPGARYDVWTFVDTGSHRGALREITRSDACVGGSGQHTVAHSRIDLPLLGWQTELYGCRATSLIYTLWLFCPIAEWLWLRSRGLRSPRH